MPEYQVIGFYTRHGKLLQEMGSDFYTQYGTFLECERHYNQMIASASFPEQSDVLKYYFAAIIETNVRTHGIPVKMWSTHHDVAKQLRTLHVKEKSEIEI